LKNYETTFDALKKINKKCIEEDETYKKSLYKRERGLSHFNKEKRNEKNKYSLNLTQKTLIVEKSCKKIK
jgi:hypothetical protein